MRKKIIAAFALFLAACNGAAATQEPAEQTPPAEKTEDITEQSDSEAESGSVIWVKEPVMKLDSVTEMEAHPYILGASVELQGDPAEWAKANEQLAGYSVPDYRTDALIASSGGEYGIIDYDGNVLYPFCLTNGNPSYNGTPVVYQPYTGFVIWDKDGMAYLISASLDSISYIRTGGLGGYAPSPYVIDHEVWIDDPQTMEPYHYENSFGVRIMTDVTDSERNVTGCAVIDTDSSILMETPHFCNAFINGFVTVSENSDWLDPGRLGFVSAEGKEITDGTVYEEAGWFSDGYAPVKIDGMWAYIDEQGRQVTDAVFTDASAVNNGRAFVQTGGLYGILDLAGTLEKGIPINAETIGSGYQEEPLDMPPVPKAKTLGTVKILVSNLNSREYPSVSSQKMDKVAAGEEWPVYLIEKADGYTWYMIEPGRWIADDGSWVEYHEN